MPVAFHYIDVQAFCYATEDEQRVERAMRTMLPDEYEIERQENTGYAGDRIVVLSARVENADDIRHLLTQLGRIDQADGTRLLEELDQRITENCELYLSLDKQAALSGVVKLGDGISIRGKVEAYPAKKESAVDNVEETLAELLED